MPILTIRESHATENGFAATVSIDRQAEYPIEVRDPFTAEQERELEFYFEEWIQFPFDEQVKADRAAASVTTYGEALFQQVFADPDAYSDYKQVCRQGLTNLEIAIQGNSPEFQALHWEALKDPQQPKPLAVEVVFTRKRFQRGGQPIDLTPSPTINLLVVTARPDEESDVGYRTISRPLIDAIQQAKLRVNVELLRPGTFAALSDHLDGKAGQYHIVHFDVHGCLLTYPQFEAGVTQSRYVFQQRYGRGDLQPYDGVKAFLFLEGQEKGQADPVEAEELAALLTNQGIPICILNACQSGKQVRSPLAPLDKGGTSELPLTKGDAAGRGIMDTRETSLGSRLMAAGVQMVVAMGYSVTVTAAALMMQTLYSKLFEQRGIPEAIRLGRKELHNQKERRVYFNQTVDLEDWLLPVVYGNRPVDLKLREMGLEEEEAYLEALDERESRYAFAEPTYGFIGRDLEILKIEKALLRHNVLLLRGMGGTGKTTLLRYLWGWWLTTRFVVDGFYFGYDEKAHTVAQIVHELGQRVYGRAAAARFLAMSETAQQRKLAQTLCEQRYVLILDNLESVTGQALAIQNTLPEVERQKLAQFLQRLRGGKTLVVLGSRSGEDWLAATFTVNGRRQVYDLRGLDKEARTVLAEKILGPKQLASLREDREFERLMDLLAGYPLAITVVLRNLVRKLPSEVLEALEKGDVDFDPGDGDKTSSILKCMEYSYSNLSLEAQKLSLCLAPFHQIIFLDYLPNYVNKLRSFNDLKSYDFDQLASVVKEVKHWGLLSQHKSGIPNLLTIHPIFPWFLNTKINHLEKELIHKGFIKHYQGLAWIYQHWMQSTNLREQRCGIFFGELEYENLLFALNLCFEEQDNISIFIIYRCLDAYLDLIQDQEEVMQLSQRICAVLESQSEQVLCSIFGFLVSEALLKKGIAFLQADFYDSAEKTHYKSIEFLKKIKVISSKDRRLGIANNYHQLGMISHSRQNYDSALTYYKKALEIKIEFNDHHGQAVTCGQLGKLFQAQQNWTQAQWYLHQASTIFHECCDLHNQAVTYHNLGGLFAEQ